jgi:hypothetical protein
MSVVRQFMYGVDTERGLNNTFSFPTLVEDLNGDDKAITCMYKPRSRGPHVNILQEQSLIAGKGLGKMYRAFRNDVAQDDGTNIIAEGILVNIDPTRHAGRTSNEKRFISLEFTMINPVAKGLTLYHAIDQENPHKLNVTWTQLDADSASDIAGIPNGIGNNISIRILDSTNDNTSAVFDGFVVRFLQLGQR